MTTIYRGDNTGAFGNDFLRIYLNNPNNLAISKAVVQVNDDIEKIYDDPIFPLRLNFTGDETELLQQQNTVRMAIWDINGKRRTAEGKFSFLVKENLIHEQDNPLTDDDYQYASPDYSITFDLSDTEFAAKFSINASPSNISELNNDLNYVQMDNIIQGENVRLEKRDNKVVINADADIVTDYDDLENIPVINGVPVKGNLSLYQLGITKLTDWNATSGPEAIINKPDFAQVSFTGKFEDLIDAPYIPTKTSDLENDSEFVTKDTTLLTNYIKTSDLLTYIEGSSLYQDIFDELRLKANTAMVETKLANKLSIDDLQAELVNYVSDTDLISVMEQQSEQFVNKIEFQNKLDEKVDKSQLGKSSLNIHMDGVDYVFNADQHHDVDVDINIPRNTSELNNDAHFLTADEAGIASLATKRELQELSDVALRREDVGSGLITVRANEEILGQFNLNSSNACTIDLQIPTDLGQLTNTPGYLKSIDIGNLDVRVAQIAAAEENLQRDVADLQNNIDTKVTKIEGKDLISVIEMERLSQVDNYDDSGILRQINTINSAIVDLSDTKVTKEEGKVLSSNDYTDADKLIVDSVSTDFTEINNRIDLNSNHISQIRSDAAATNAALNELLNDLTNEISAREVGDINLQNGLDVLKNRPIVVDVVNDYTELTSYNKTSLNIGDIVIVLSDESQNGSMVAYSYVDPSFTIHRIQPKCYTQTESDSIFVNKSTSVNGKALTQNITLTASDVGALPDSLTIGEGVISIMVNNNLLDSFSANATLPKTINLSIPYKTSELENDTGFINGDGINSLINPINNAINNQSLIIAENTTNIETNRRAIEGIQEILTGETGTLPAVMFTGSYLDLIDKPTIPTKVSELLNDEQYVTKYSLEADFATKEDIPKVVSALENDRGYVTTNAIGRGILTFKINNNEWENNTWMANEKYDQTLDIPVQNSLSTSSTLPIASNTICTETNRIDTSAVHKAGAETITGNKTFSGTITSNNLALFNNDIRCTKNASISSFGDNLVTSQWVKSFTDTNVIHTTGNTAETITGQKTFQNKTILNESVCVYNIPLNDNSTQIATTKFVKDQDYCTNTGAVHKTGNIQESIDGDKTFTETVTFDGNVDLGTNAIAETKATETNDTSVATTAYVKNQDYATNTQLEERCHLVEKSMDVMSEYSLRLQTKVDVLENDLNEQQEQIDAASAYMVDTNEAIAHLEETADEMAQTVQEAKSAVYAVDPARFVLKEENNQITGINNFTNTVTVNTANSNSDDRTVANTQWVNANYVRKDSTEFSQLVANNNSIIIRADKYYYVEMTSNKNLILSTPNVTDNSYHKIILQVSKTDNAQLVLDSTHTLTNAGIYEVTYIWHKAANQWVLSIQEFN